MYHSQWLCLVIGNSRSHWALFQQGSIVKSWHTNHVDGDLVITLEDLWTQFIPPEVPTNIPLHIASVVPSQTQIWQKYPRARCWQLADIPLANTYPTLGIDRAIAVWRAGNHYGFPCLVIDAGTALTFTGAKDGALVGGAILPGLRLQFQSLHTSTAELPKTYLDSNLPPRWADNTSEAIVSGILYTILAGIESYLVDWCDRFPDSKVILTGGDGITLYNHLTTTYSDLVDRDRLIADEELIFWGIADLVRSS